MQLIGGSIAQPFNRRGPTRECGAIGQFHLRNRRALDLDFAAHRRQRMGDGVRDELPELDPQCLRLRDLDDPRRFERLKLGQRVAKRDGGLLAARPEMAQPVFRIPPLGEGLRHAHPLREARKGHETRIAYVEKDGQKWATEVILKGPVKVAKEDLVNFEFIRKQVEKPDANVVLIDSRPLPRFQQGTIPGAINIPYPAWDKVAAKLKLGEKRLLWGGNFGDIYVDPALKPKLRAEWLDELARRTGREVRLETNPALALETTSAQIISA